jgi:hypothetical protein
MKVNKGYLVERNSGKVRERSFFIARERSAGKRGKLED